MRCELCGENITELTAEARSAHVRECEQLCEGEEKENAGQAEAAASSKEAAADATPSPAASAAQDAAPSSGSSSSSSAVSSIHRDEDESDIHRRERGAVAAARPTPLWALGARRTLSPSEHAAPSFRAHVPSATTSAPSHEGVVCAVCSMYIALDEGAVCGGGDGAGGSELAMRCRRCSEVAERLGLVRPRKCKPELEDLRARPRVDVSEGTAMRDLSASAAHVHRLLRAGGEAAAIA